VDAEVIHIFLHFAALHLLFGQTVTVVYTVISSESALGVCAVSVTYY